MTHKRCYICYEMTLDDAQYHKKCLKKLFATEHMPKIAFNSADIESLALELIKQKIGVPGVQQKLSLSLISSQENEHISSRLTIMGYLGGEYILKPPTPEYPQMPEIEDLTMHLAALANIEVALHGLIPMSDGKLAYITKRFDRKGKQKIAVEDLCQLSQKLTENKYRSSSEQVGKTITYYTTIPGEAALKFFELILFCFLVGNADMHLKNFSLITQDLAQIVLAPSYDLLSTRLLIPEHYDSEELALTVNGKKSNFRQKDFVAFGKNLNIPEKVIYRTIDQFVQILPRWKTKIVQSFLDDKLKEQYQDLIALRMQRVLGQLT